MSDAAPMPPEESTPSAPQGLSGQTLPSGLFVVSRLCDSAEGRLYAGISTSGHEVTLLVLNPEATLSSQLRQRTREERLDKIKAVHHPNIAKIYGTDVASDGTPCIVMEPFSGEPLSAILAARGAVPLSVAMDLSLQAAAGLTEAHAAGVVHGNVSPETMLLTRTADGHRLKLIGFSLGLFVDGSRNGGRENARYAGLEQRCGVAADEQSDVYSVAAVLHHLVSGSPPEAGGVVADSIPRRLKAVLERALADNRSDRYPTMAALAAELERAAGPDEGRVEQRGLRSRLLGVAATIAVVAGLWLLWGSRQAGMRAEAEARSTAKTERPVPPDSIVFGPVEGGVSFRSAAAKKTESQERMSPFRRSHPWAAYPEGKFYYPSSCSQTLEFDDLVYFATEKEAQAAGYLPSRSARCP